MMFVTEQQKLIYILPKIQYQLLYNESCDFPQLSNFQSKS